MTLDRNSSVRYLKGVGEKRAQLYGKMGILTIEDLLNHIPRKYLDCRKPVSAAEALLGTRQLIRGTVVRKSGEARIRRSLSLFKVEILDDNFPVELTFFNGKYTVENIVIGKEYLFFGPVQGSLLRKTMNSPEVYGAEEEGALLPIYSLTTGMSNKMLRTNITEALASVEFGPDPLSETGLLEKYNLCSYEEAIREIHHPKDWESMEKSRDRMAFQELLTLTLTFRHLKNGRRQDEGFPMKEVSLEPYIRQLPYQLTGAQNRVIEECVKDMTGPAPMNRLVQGDVGSGKTAIAAALCYMAFENGAQSAFMAPTEILATQHYEHLKEELEPLGMKIGLLIGSLPESRKKELKKSLFMGEIDCLIGTHAILTPTTRFQSLGLVITDEQHRFGVEQRKILSEKGKRPHVMVMSATPIPRTLGLIIYGDMEISVVDELPKGRLPIKTYLIGSEIRERAYGFIRKQIDEGFQGYIVCPAIGEEEDNPLELQEAVKLSEELSRGPFRDYKVGLLHGKMKGSEKDQIMEAFRKGEIQLLISTTVIEVGVDVPNATIMLIENAERFGLSQLHQLRGRVGRGHEKSYCILVSDAQKPETQTRLKTMTKTMDGFKIAEEDLRERGPGDFLGNRQHGLPTLQIADLTADGRLLKWAEDSAEELMEKDPELLKLLPLRKQVDKLWDKMSL